MANIKYMNYGILGAVATLVTGFLLSLISNLVSLIPGVTLDLQSITIQTTGLTSVIGTGLGTYAQKLLGYIPFLSVGEWAIAAIGGALFVMLGAYIVDTVKALQFAKTKQGKLATIFVIAGIVSGWILAMSISIPTISLVIAMAVDAYILAYILAAADKALKTNLVP